MCNSSIDKSFEGMPNIVVWYHKIWLPTVEEINAIESKLPTLKEMESMSIKEVEDLINDCKLLTGESFPL